MLAARGPPHSFDAAVTAAVRILLVSGSTRAGSTNTAVLRTAPLVAPADVSTSLYAGLTVLPAFNPDDDPTRCRQRWRT